MSSSPYSSRGLRKSPIDDRDSSVRNALINRAATRNPSITRDDINSIRERNAANERQVRRDAIGQRGIVTRNEVRNQAANLRSELTNNSASLTDRLNKVKENLGVSETTQNTGSQDTASPTGGRHQRPDIDKMRERFGTSPTGGRHQRPDIDKMRERFGTSGAIQRPSITRDAGATRNPSINRDNMNSIRERNAANERKLRRDAIGQRGIATRNEVREEAMAAKAKIKAEQFKNSQSNM